MTVIGDRESAERVHKEIEEMVHREIEEMVHRLEEDHPLAGESPQETEFRQIDDLSMREDHLPEEGINTEEDLRGGGNTQDEETFIENVLWEKVISMEDEIMEKDLLTEDGPMKKDLLMEDDLMEKDFLMEDILWMIVILMEDGNWAKMFRTEDNLEATVVEKGHRLIADILLVEEWGLGVVHIHNPGKGLQSTQGCLLRENHLQIERLFWGLGLFHRLEERSLWMWTIMLKKLEKPGGDLKILIEWSPGKQTG